MKKIVITAPVKKESGPVRDFANAVKAQCGNYDTETFYSFGVKFVRFYVFRKQLGADFFSPVKSAAGNLYSVERVTSKGKRVNLGLANIFD